ncbi:MAG: phosphatidate cytidylyltransferase [Deltaproteobacteria bacterium]
MLRTRLLTAAVALPAVVWLIFAGPLWAFAGVVVALTALGLGELVAMAFPERPGTQALTVLAGLAFAAVVVLDRPDLVGPVLVLVIVGGFLFALACDDLDRGVRQVTHGLVAAIYVGFLLPHAVSLRALPGGERWVFLAIAAAMAADTGGYFAGRAWGKTPLAPRISPKKTVEGAVGGLLGSTLMAGLVLVLLPPPGYDLIAALIAGPAIGIISQAGDLIESMLKRVYGAKDSGWIIPGHGGVLDRIDSLVLPLVFTYYLGAGMLFEIVGV